MSKEKIQLNLPELKILPSLPDWYRPFFEKLIKTNQSLKNRTDLQQVNHDIVETSWDDNSYPPIY